YLSRKERENFLMRVVRWRMAPSRCLWERAIMRSRWQSRITSSDGGSCCAWLIPKEFIWRQNDKPWHTLDENASGPCCTCGFGMDDSRLCVCLAGSLYRHGPAPRPLCISHDLVVLGFGHPSHSLGGPADPRFQ